MRFLVAAIILALAWAAVSGSFSPLNLVFGLAVGALSLFLVRGQGERASYRVRPLALLALVLLFIKELALSAWKVAVLVASPKMKLRPGIFAFPLTVERDFEITLLANLITLTPGTLSVDVSEDRRYLYVHALDCSDPVSARRDIADGFERRIREAFQ